MSDPSTATRDEARHNMVDNQLRANKVHDDRVLDAFLRLQRELFVPPGLRGVAYIDEDLPVGAWALPDGADGGGAAAAGARGAAEGRCAGCRRRGRLRGGGCWDCWRAASSRSKTIPELARIGRSALVDHRIASVTYVEAPLAGGASARARPMT